MPCFTAMRAEIALMSGSAFAVTYHAFSSGAGRTSDGNGSHASTLKSPSYTKSVSWQHYPSSATVREPGVPSPFLAAVTHCPKVPSGRDNREAPSLIES
ncbi:putative IS1 encoded protein [Shigella flexneri K-315]|uniref:Putative IS1 encoded protein n=1 Tax=Shigella flexneri K-315 TaxID=766150 RepID=I6CP84_SHIFL|nr:putative IS1 encoded protein [Shigella flexneri K-315]